MSESAQAGGCPMKGIADYNLLDPAVMAAPWEFYELLHKEQPVYQMPETGIYVVTRYEDVMTVLKDTVTYSNVILAMEALQGDNGRRYQEMLREVNTIGSKSGWVAVRVTLVCRKSSEPSAAFCAWYLRRV